MKRVEVKNVESMSYDIKIVHLKIVDANHVVN